MQRRTGFRMGPALLAATLAACGGATTVTTTDTTGGAAGSTGGGAGQGGAGGASGGAGGALGGSDAGQPPPTMLEIYSWLTAGSEKLALDALFGELQKRYPGISIVNAATGRTEVAQMELPRRIASGMPPD